jgi:serine/threonine-protein kinase
MSLQRATRVGHYEITAKLGEGGMGEVYRAQDSKLQREVAIKMLPLDLAADPERLARFEREAKLLASLNHPNIAAIYGLEESGGVRALVMELVEGPTLAERIARGPLQLEEALAIARQIAEALEAAHERGIIHRDLKPANIKLRPDGAVKVLDFGLAKAMEKGGGLPSGTQLAHSPTITAMGTVHGMILGTAAYMAPEQAAGFAVDYRADIWAFGVVLWEMLSGRTLFGGETVSHVLAAVLKDEPHFADLPPGTPPAILDLLRHCLVKKPKQRLQSIGDARVVIEETIAAPSLTIPAPTAAVAPSSTARTWKVLPWLVAAAATALLAVTLVRQRPQPAPAHAEPPMRFALSLPAGQLVEPIESAVAISPDGRRLVAVVRGEDGTRHLLARQLDEIEPRPLPGTEQAISPFFSPDSEWIAFFSGAEIKKVAFAGGPAVTVASGVGQNRGGTWGADEMLYVAANTEGGLSRVSAQGGVNFEPITQLDPQRSERTHRWPHALPNGKAVLFTSDTTSSTEFYDDARIEAVILATGERKVVVEQSSRAQYLAPGYLIFARGGALFASPFDLESLAMTGPPRLVFSGVATDVATGAAQFAVSAAGSILYVPGGLSTGAAQPLWVDRGGRATPAVAEASGDFQLSLAPDDRRVAFVSTAGQNTDLWILDTQRGSRSRFTFEGSPESPVWTHDGARLAYRVTAEGGATGRVMWRAADGGSEAEILFEDSNALLNPTSFSSDGASVAMDAFTSGRASDIWILPLAGDRKPWVFAETRFDEGGAVFSPDGRWLAYASDEGGRYDVFVRSFPDRGGKWQVSTGGGLEPRWSGDGKALFYRDRGALYQVAIDTAGGFSAGPPERLFEGVRTGTNAHTYSVTSDGRFLILPPAQGSENATQLNLVLNWPQEIERLARPARGR